MEKYFTGIGWRLFHVIALEVTGKVLKTAGYFFNNSCQVCFG